MLARREHSRAELTQKLIQRGYPRAEVASVVDDFANQGWQSDERYINAYIRARAARAYGPERIAMELKERGLDREMIARHIMNTEWDWIQLAKTVILKKFDSSPAENFEELMKRKQHLVYRGFTLSQINATIKQITEEQLL